jgi:hypothetical protein
VNIADTTIRKKSKTITIPESNKATLLQKSLIFCFSDLEDK